MKVILKLWEVLFTTYHEKDRRPAMDISTNRV